MTIATLKYRIAVFKLCVLAVFVPWACYQIHRGAHSARVSRQVNDLYRQANEATDKKDFQEADRLLKQAKDLSEKEWGKL